MSAVLFESSRWARFLGRAKTYADWVWYSSEIGELCTRMNLILRQSTWLTQETLDSWQDKNRSRVWTDNCLKPQPRTSDMRKELTGPLGAEGRGRTVTKQTDVYQDCGLRGTWGRDLRPLTTWSKEREELIKILSVKKEGKGLGTRSRMRGDPRRQSRPQRPRRSRWSCRRRESKQKHDSPCYGTQKIGIVGLWKTNCRTILSFAKFGRE